MKNCFRGVLALAGAAACAARKSVECAPRKQYFITFYTMAKITYKDEHGKIHDIALDTGKSILEMLEAQGIDYPFSCMAGACSTCKITVHKGKEKLELDKFGTPLMPVEDNEFLTCVCGISEDVAKDETLVIELEKAEQ